MHHKSFAFMLLLCTAGAITAADEETAGLAQGSFRVGGSLRLESFENETNAEFEATLGFLPRPYLEPGLMLGMTKREGTDVFGKAGASLLWHILPSRSVVPGVGVQLTRTLGYPVISGESGNFTVGEVFGNLEVFVSPSLSFTMRGAYQSWWGELFDSRGFVFRAGISTFLGAGGR
ncbi:MAG: hypothetical protein FVQ81_12700 [Candidatus Glassbacteria bacterium]|nr:hypothetical protein [Candidatus Glassbacteria bacterium]